MYSHGRMYVLTYYLQFEVLWELLALCLPHGVVGLGVRLGQRGTLLRRQRLQQELLPQQLLRRGVNGENRRRQASCLTLQHREQTELESPTFYFFYYTQQKITDVKLLTNISDVHLLSVCCLMYWTTFLCTICALEHFCTNRQPKICAQTVDEYFGC